MSAQSIEQPYPIFTDADGDPLEAGYIWIGVENLNPITDPVAVYWDAALTQPAVQPIRTAGGYLVNAGTPARLYVSVRYSILAQDRNGITVYSAPSETALISSDELTFLQAGTGAVTRTAQDKMRESVSVLDFGADPTGASDSAAAFQAAARAANVVSGGGNAPGGTVFVPNGTYLVSTVGIRGTLFVGQNRERTIIKGTGVGAATQFMFDAQLDLDGITTNTVGGGWCESMTIDANGSGRSLLRTYGGGARPTSLVLKNAVTSGAIGLSMGLPIWATVSNVYAENCYTGFFTFSGAGDNGTSTTFIGCWANACLNYGFHITQLYYSSFINCVAQDCVTRNWYVQGDSNSVTTVYSLQFIGCATEGSGVPFYFRNVRDLTLQNPRVISPASGVNLVALDNCSGTVSDFSTPSALSGGAYHLAVTNHASGTGSIKVVGGVVTYNPADATATDAIAAVGPSYGRFQNAKSANYTLTIDDAGKTILLSSGAGVTFTIPANASVAYPVGTEISFANRSGSNLSIACTSDTMLLATTFTSGTRTLATQSMAVAIKVEATTWIIGSIGGGLT